MTVAVAVRAWWWGWGWAVAADTWAVLVTVEPPAAFEGTSTTTANVADWPAGRPPATQETVPVVLPAGGPAQLKAVPPVWDTDPNRVPLGTASVRVTAWA